MRLALQVMAAVGQIERLVDQRKIRTMLPITACSRRAVVPQRSCGWQRAIRLPSRQSARRIPDHASLRQIRSRSRPRQSRRLTLQLAIGNPQAALTQPYRPSASSKARQPARPRRPHERCDSPRVRRRRLRWSPQPGGRGFQTDYAEERRQFGPSPRRRSDPARRRGCAKFHAAGQPAKVSISA